MILVVILLLSALLVVSVTAYGYQETIKELEADRLRVAKWIFNEGRYHLQVRQERDAYIRGLGIISNMKTENMAHIGKRMAAAADEALQNGIDI